MKETESQIYQSVLCPIRNCEIPAHIFCSANEIQDALSYGKIYIPRKATHNQDNNPNITGCESYGEEGETKFIFNDKGDIVSYSLPYHPDIDLNFSLLAGLVPYGEDIQGLLISSTNQKEEENKIDKIIQNLNSALYVSYNINRKIFPPDKITHNGKNYEIIACALCENYKCDMNKGKMDINPLPLVPKE